MCCFSNFGPSVDTAKIGLLQHPFQCHVNERYPLLCPLQFHAVLKERHDDCGSQLVERASLKRGVGANPNAISSVVRHPGIVQSHQIDDTSMIGVLETTYADRTDIRKRRELVEQQIDTTALVPAGRCNIEFVLQAVTVEYFPFDDLKG